jgi:hypothetical protein
MSLKCPFCGKEYFHDRKICQTCEEKSKNNINIPETYTYVHYEQTSAFGRKKPDKVCIQLAFEPKFSAFKSKGDTNWKFNPRFRNLDDLKSEILQFNATDSKILEKKNTRVLNYE